MQKFAFAVVPGMTVCALVLLVMGVQKTGNAPANRAWAMPLALGIAMMLAFAVVVQGRFTWPPDERWKWLAVANLVAMGLGMLASLRTASRIEELLFAACAAVAMSAMLHPTPVVEHAWAMRIALGAVVLVVAASLMTMNGLRQGAFGPIALALCFIGAAIVSFRSGFGTLSLLMWAVALALLVAAVFARKPMQAPFAPGAALWCGAMLPMMLALTADAGYNTGEVSLWCFAMIALSPLMMWIAEGPLVRRRNPLTQIIVRIVLVAIPVITAVTGAMRGE